MGYGSAPFTFNGTTSPPPAAGEVRLDAMTQADASVLYVSDTTSTGADLSAVLGSLILGDVVRIWDVIDATTFATFDVTDAATAETGYHSVPVALSTDYPSGKDLRDGRAVEVVPITAANAVATYATAEELAAALRITVTEKNGSLLEASVAAASREIDHQIGRDPLDPLAADDPLAHMVCLARGVEWFKANDAAFGMVGFDATGVLTAPRDGFARHAADLVPLTQTFGVA